MIVYAGNKLQANPAAIAGDPTPSTAWQWTRNGIAITGATASTYVASAQDLGSNLSVIQQAINLVGTAVATASAVGPVTLFSPAVMFSTGINGVWYDPSDLSTLYRDAAGTLPVTAVEQPVGLMLDKSKGLVLGPELVTFAALTGTAEWSYGSNVWTLTNSTTNSQTLSFAGLTSGAWYRLSVTVTAINAGSLTFRHPNSSTLIPSSPTISSAGTYTVYFQASGTTVFLRNSAVGQNIAVSAFSVRELPGNHAFNSSGNSANFPVLSARYNLLTKTEQFDDAVWVKTTSYISVDSVIAPNGVLSADTYTTQAGNSEIAQAITNTATTVTASIYVKKNTTRYCFIQIVNALGGSNAVRQFFDLDANSGSGATATAQTFGSGFAKVSASITPESNGWLRATLTCTVPAANCYFVFSTSSTNAPATIAANQSIYIWGADLRVANDALNQPAYQRVNTATDYDTVGFKPYLRFNGTNQWLQTNSIDFTYGDKMFVSAGVRKLSDATTNFVAELSSSLATNDGVISVFAPVSAGATYTSVSKGSVQSVATTSASYAAPITNVVSGISNISADQCILRVNGTQAAINTADQGTGNYGNYPLYIGARAGSSLWFNGRLYGLTVAGKQASASEISGNEYFLNSKTNAY